MPKYYCDYCDKYLTHDSPSVRKSHNEGWKHKTAVREYYSQFEVNQFQALINERIQNFESKIYPPSKQPGAYQPGGPLAGKNQMVPQFPPGQMPPQFPPGQIPQFPPGQMPQFPPGQMPPQFPPGQIPQFPPGQMPQFPPGQMPPQMQQMPPQFPPGKMPPQMPPQFPPGQMPPQMQQIPPKK
eukprot:TRINITY_DN19539_c1_g1_i1.p1 TRINITY_DN19539_c1_g1~~TRINITY_DN19539_c1_g1_i1.p1  ORF type:complete len:183 (-),score=43.16 TRINITY_DN19539_c1_g1_i1:90-638(-)